MFVDTVNPASSADPPVTFRMFSPDKLNWKPAIDSMFLMYIGIDPEVSGNVIHSLISTTNEFPVILEKIGFSIQTSPERLS